MSPTALAFPEQDLLERDSSSSDSLFVDSLEPSGDIDLIGFLDAFEDQAVCRTYDPEVFFADSPDGVEYAKSLCSTCPLRPQCLAGAIARREPWGVWGGELFIQGVVVPRKRPRGRPRKTEVAA